MNVWQYLRASRVNFEREYFGKKQVHNFTTLDPFKKLLPHLSVI
jgi:hypothetical protein